MRRCWVNFQCRGVLLTWITVWQGPIVLAVGAGGGCLDIFSLIYYFSFLSPSLWETARYRLKYCLKGPLSPKQSINQPTTSPRRQCDVITPHRHHCDFISTSCACWVRPVRTVWRLPTVDVNGLLMLRHLSFIS